MANIYDTVQDGTVLWTIKGTQKDVFPNKLYQINDANNANTPGIYQFSDTTINVPGNIGQWGLIVTFTAHPTYIEQICFRMNHMGIFYREYSDNHWGEWEKITIDNEIINSKLIGINGYVKLGSLLGGLIIQWGRCPIEETDTTVTFPISFSTIMSISAQLYNNSKGCYVYSLSLSGFKIASSESSSKMWLAIGY